MALQQGFRAAKNFKRLACGISHLRMKSYFPDGWEGAAGKRLQPTNAQGGGAGGSIREAGGTFAKMERAREEEYFLRTQKGQFKMLRDHIQKEITERELLVRELQKQIERNKKIIEDLKQQHHQ
ncbi:ATPase inhibitor mai-2, mitochondrial-like [Rhipicephalus sanguineus]|uniref:ATPase inhibitor mai-2, mitochondrial-like n=1 Tax=Rhipicephalus sanguineus TaxID=34632 RepID=UPI0020C37FC2|nr:ATPase inhibitor mai-2, mitochondrial-like [Rhipicephalus sanguineus]